MKTSNILNLGYHPLMGLSIASTANFFIGFAMAAALTLSGLYDPKSQASELSDGMIVYICVVAPIVESLLLAGLASWIQCLSKKRSVAVFISAAFFSALHLLNSWQSAIVVFAPFCFQAWLYLTMRARGARRLVSIAFVVAVHALNNMVITAFEIAGTRAPSP